MFGNNIFKEVEMKKIKFCCVMNEKSANPCLVMVIEDKGKEVMFFFSRVQVESYLRKYKNEISDEERGNVDVVMQENQHYLPLKDAKFEARRFTQEDAMCVDIVIQCFLKVARGKVEVKKQRIFLANKPEKKEYSQ